MHALERFTGPLISRQRELYAADLPFADKWRTAMRYLVSEDVSPPPIGLSQQIAQRHGHTGRAQLGKKRWQTSR